MHDQTADEWGILLRTLFSLESLALTARSMAWIIVASVVPPLDSTPGADGAALFRPRGAVRDSLTDTGLTIRYDNPRGVGADRIVNGVAALSVIRRALRGGRPRNGDHVRCDLGQCRISGRRDRPGIGISIESLFTKTARLPLVDFREPEKLIGTNTVASMQSGLYYGAIGMIDGILERLMAELGEGTRCVATGGQARLIVQGSRYLRDVDET